jgi:hypothetical protein
MWRLRHLVTIAAILLRLNVSPLGAQPGCWVGCVMTRFWYLVVLRAISLPLKLQPATLPQSPQQGPASQFTRFWSAGSTSCG